MQTTASQTYLFIKKEQQVLEKVLLGKASLTLGRRGFGADIEIDFDLVSRRHAVIRQDNYSFEITDSDSTNGTFVNGKKIEKAVLQIGDTISFRPQGSKVYLVFGTEEEAGPVEENYTSYSIQKVPAFQNIYTLIQERKTLTIGRNDCNINLPELIISRKHTKITLQEDGQYLVEDLGSKNGTFVNGTQIDKQSISENDLIQIGRYEFSLNPLGESPLLQQEDIIRVENVRKTIGKGDKSKTILQEVNFKIGLGEIVAIMGPSGSGKSTLLKALNGYSPASKGRVFIQGKDFYKNYRRLKQVIGYVPQDDIVHAQLSVYDSLYYSARLRLPSDVSKDEIRAKIDDILSVLRISHIKNNKIKAISGGQRKRVAIAVELLSDPSILFLDEPTSPLDPETVGEFLAILQKLAEKGTTILMVTHKPDDLNSADKVLFLSKGGYLTYFGETANYLDYFKAKNVIEVYSHINDLEKGRIWAKTFKEKYLSDLETFSTTPDIEQPPKQSGVRQLFWLQKRYFKIKTNDRLNTLLLLFQAPLIALLLSLIFKKLMLGTLFLMTIAAIWLGTSNSARELVAEISIYRRERMFNLRILPYIFSKIFVINLFSFIQMLLMVSIVYWLIGLEYYWQHVFVLFFLAFTSSLLGLLLSSLAGNADKVMSLVPLVLLPQIMLAGVIQRIDKQSEWLSFLTISRWGIESSAQIEQKAYFYYPDSVPNMDYFKAIENINPLDTARTKQVKDSLQEAQIKEKLYDYRKEEILGNANMLTYPQYFEFRQILIFLGIYAFVLFLGLYMSLRLKDRL